MNISPLNKAELAIIILNWNGWQDTCECLASLLDGSFQDFQVLLIDNGSTDDSLRKIKSWLKGLPHPGIESYNRKLNKNPVSFLEIKDEEIVQKQFQKDIGSYKILLVKNRFNLGFAKGCNLGIRFSLSAGFPYILLLNNDTTVDGSCLKFLMSFMNQNPEFGIVTPKIYYYDKPDTIWNCGGKLTFTGKRKYYYINKKDNRHTLNGHHQISFVTGCALFSRSDIFRDYGPLSENFFFGEEDYEFSLKMKKNDVKMASLFCAKVYHKIGATERVVFEKNRLPKAFVFYLNRYIDLKSYYPLWYWRIWRIFSLLYIIPFLLINYKVTVPQLGKFVFLLLKYSSEKDRVQKETFFQAKEIFI